MRSLVVTLLLWTALALPPCARSARAGDAFSAASIVPADVDLFIAVDEASQWRRGPGGAILDRAGRELAAAGNLAEAWNGLAAILGLEGERAFDDLLGRRVVFAQRAPRDPARPAAWVLISLIPRETEALLRQRLKPAPRRVEKGIAVLSLEDGRFWLAAIAGKTGATVMLAPAAAPELFDELVTSLGQGAHKSLAASKLGEDLRTVQRGSDALLLRRARDAAGNLVLIHAAARRAEQGLDLAMILRSGPIGERTRAVRPTSRRLFDEISTDAFAAAVEWNTADIAGSLGLALPALPLPMAIRNFEGRAWLGDRLIYAAHPSPAGGAELAIAVEATDVARLAPAADRLIADLLRGWWNSPAAPEPDAAMLDFGGQFPGSLREIDLSTFAADEATQQWTRGLRLAWCYPSRDMESWWTFGLGADAVERLARRVTVPSDPADPLRPWISLGVVRPASIARALDAAAITPPAPLRPAVDGAREIEQVQWSVERSEGDSIRGEATVRFVPAAARP